jgi:pimeloyl-ACP methyl ester carboxylesterase
MLDDDEQLPQFKPATKERFQEMLSHYRYDQTPLEAKELEVNETSEWRREKIIYWGAAGERAIAYLWLPRTGPQPYQVIQYKPGGASYKGLTAPQETELVCGPFIKSGRAVCVVVVKGMTERNWPPGFVDPDSSTVKYRELVVNDTVDQRRFLDYLTTRTEVDMSKLGCFALSLGGWDLVQMAIEQRYRAIMFLSAGLSKNAETTIAEANPVNFAPYISDNVPKLMMNGRYDEGAPLKTAAEPLFQLLSEPKELVVFESGHFPPLEQWVPVAQNWLDKTLGSVTSP